MAGELQRRLGGARATSAAALLALALAGCAGGGGDLSSRAVIPPDPPKQQAEMQPAAQREHQRILGVYGGAYEDAALEAALNQTTERLVSSSERPDLHYKVTILNSPAVNAFALPTGQLYVTRGLLALANDNAELASVLSHEMAHVIARHAAIREDQLRQATLVSRVASDVLSDPQMGALALAKSKIALASFSRAQEFEADGIGVGISSRAGFDPYGATRFLSSMERNAALRASSSKSDPHLLDFLSSHPSTPERVRNAQLNARQYVAPGPGARDQEAYLESLNGLVYGEDPSDGFVRGRRFLHPKLGFTFTAPEGFALDNSAQAVFGIKDGGEQALRLDIVRVPPEQNLSQYLNSGWLDNIDVASVQELSINDFPAATATATGDQWSFRLYAVRFGTEVYRFIFAGKTRSAEFDRIAREAVASFRRMALAEIQSAKPLRLKIVTAGAHDNVERLASRMALPDRAAERLRVLNGLGPKDKLIPGAKVKIVVE
ncbi:MAG: M48 family metalloprotease [Pseudomonadota bacterium]|nr:M48 family metalloprotease [Pseudomonadota bacterium]